MKKVYLEKLEQLQKIMDDSENSVFISYSKVLVLTTLIMRYEAIAFNKHLSKHPYILTNYLVEDAIKTFEHFQEMAFIGDDKIVMKGKSQYQEEKHEELFNTIWNKYNEKEFLNYIRRYEERIDFNGLNELIVNKDCVDFGSGNGVFSFAMLKKGANTVTGIDFGSDSILFAKKYSDVNLLVSKTEFRVATVYDTKLESNKYDFLVQNGVFHHLDDENLAIKEAKRVLKKDAWMWYYTAGEGSIVRDLLSVGVYLLKDISSDFINQSLSGMGVKREKIAHIMDALSATYRLTTWNEITTRLSGFGFGNFKRMSGGTKTDFDLDVIEKDPYGKEKFGEGDLRVLCQLLDK